MHLPIGCQHSAIHWPSDTAVVRTGHDRPAPTHSAWRYDGWKRCPVSENTHGLAMLWVIQTSVGRTPRDQRTGSLAGGGRQGEALDRVGWVGVGSAGFSGVPRLREEL